MVLNVYEASKASAGENSGVTLTIDAEDDKEGYEEDDILMVTLKPGWDDESANMDKTLLAVDDVETVEGEVTTASINNYNGWVRIDGTRDDFAWEYSQVAVERGSDGVFYLYNGYIVHFDGDANQTDEYLYVVRAESRDGDWNEDTYVAEVVYADGTSEVVDIDEESFAYVDGKGDNDAKVFTYNYNDDDEVYELSPVKGATDKGAASIEKGKTSIVKADSDDDERLATTNSKTVYVIIELDGKKLDDANVYTGYRNVKSMDVTSCYVVADGGAAEYVFAIFGSDTGDEDLIYVAGASESDDLIDDADLGEYYTYNAIVNGEIVEIMTKDKGYDGLYNTYTTNSDDIYTKLEKKNVDAVTTDEGVKFERAEDEVITIDGEAFAYAEDVAVYVIDEDGNITEGSINRNYSDVTIIYTTNDDGEVVNVYIEK